MPHGSDNDRLVKANPKSSPAPKIVNKTAAVIKKAFFIILLCALCACGGWRRGHFSMPYVGDPSSKPSSAGKPAEQRRMQKIEFSGFSVNVDLQNDVQTSDIAVAALVIPIRVDLKEKRKFSSRKTGHYITLYFTPSIDGLVFTPLKVSLNVNGETSRATKAQIFSASKTWKPEVRSKITFAKTKGYFFQIYFDGARPSPDDEISLHLNKAIYHPQHVPIEKIKFIRRNWTSPYS